MSAAWRPFSMATSAACMATIVLPEPTSPWRQAAHGVGLAHVAYDFGEDAFLRGGGVEGQDLLERGADLGRDFGQGAGTLAEAAALELEAKLEVPELFEDEAAMGGCGGGLEVGHGGAGGREVEVAQGSHAGGEVEALAEGGGEGFFGFGVGFG